MFIVIPSSPQPMASLADLRNALKRQLVSLVHSSSHINGNENFIHSNECGRGHVEATEELDMRDRWAPKSQVSGDDVFVPIETTY